MFYFLKMKACGLSYTFNVGGSEQHAVKHPDLAANMQNVGGRSELGSGEQ